MKNIESEKIIAQIAEDKEGLRDELERLKSKALAFSLMTKNSDVKNQLKDLEISLKDVEFKKSVLLDKFDRLIELIRGSS